MWDIRSALRELWALRGVFPMPAADMQARYTFCRDGHRYTTLFGSQNGKFEIRSVSYTTISEPELLLAEFVTTRDAVALNILHELTPKDREHLEEAMLLLCSPSAVAKELLAHAEKPYYMGGPFPPKV